MNKDQTLTYNEQHWAWAEAYDGYEGNDIFSLMILTGYLLKAIAGDDGANATMVALYKSFVEDIGHDPELEDYENIGWEAVWLDKEKNEARCQKLDFDLLPVAQNFTTLHSFAFGGLAPNRQNAPTADELNKVKTEIKEIVDWGSNFLQLIPGGWPVGADISNVVNAASARLKLDELNQGVTVDELAALSKVSSKSIRNILSKKDGALIQRDGVIPPEQAKAWLSQRSDYMASVYDKCDGSRGDREISLALNTVIDEAIFVPISKTDGEPFTPNLKRNGAYQIGVKGSEIHVEDYFDALAQLEKMATPKWRRPNTNGIWGIVSAGENWKRMSRRELLAYSD